MSTPRATVLIGILYTAIAIVGTWPLVRDIDARVAGGVLDPWQTIWGFWFLHHSLESGSSPFFTDLLWWPDGISLWFQTWDFPSAIWSIFFWNLLSPELLYNLPLLASFPLSGITAFLLARSLYGGVFGPCIAGCLYTFSTFHFASARMNLHMASMQWTPALIWGLVEGMRSGQRRWFLLVGFSASVTLMASVYHALFAALCIAGLAIGGLFGRTVTARIPRLALAGLVFTLCSGWLVAGMFLAYAAEPYTGDHNAVAFSTDLAALWLPGPISAWGGDFGYWRTWTGGIWTAGGHLGIVTTVLAIVASRVDRNARMFACLGLVGAVFSLGPHPHFNGRVIQSLFLPYAVLEQLPGGTFSGMPTRFSWLATFGFAVAAGWIVGSMFAGPRRTRVLASVLSLVALLEMWPTTLPMHQLPRSERIRAMSDDLERWAVLDGTDWSKALWHQTLHRHPIITGYVSRTPLALWTRASNEPVLSSFFPSPLGVARPGFETPPTHSVAYLKAVGVRYVLVDEGNAWPVRLGLPHVFTEDNVAVYEVRD